MRYAGCAYRLGGDRLVPISETLASGGSTKRLLKKIDIGGISLINERKKLQRCPYHTNTSIMRS